MNDDRGAHRVHEALHGRGVPHVQMLKPAAPRHRRRGVVERGDDVPAFGRRLQQRLPEQPGASRHQDSPRHRMRSLSLSGSPRAARPLDRTAAAPRAPATDVSPQPRTDTPRWTRAGSPCNSTALRSRRSHGRHPYPRDQSGISTPARHAAWLPTNSRWARHTGADPRWAEADSGALATRPSLAGASPGPEITAPSEARDGISAQTAPAPRQPAADGETRTRAQRTGSTHEPGKLETSPAQSARSGRSEPLGLRWRRRAMKRRADIRTGGLPR